MNDLVPAAVSRISPALLRMQETGRTPAIHVPGRRYGHVVTPWTPVDGERRETSFEAVDGMLRVVDEKAKPGEKRVRWLSIADARQRLNNIADQLRRMRQSGVWKNSEIRALQAFGKMVYAEIKKAERQADLKTDPFRRRAPATPLILPPGVRDGD